MLSQNYAIDTFLYPLKAYYAAHNRVDNGLSHIIESLRVIISDFVLSEYNTKIFANTHLDTLFDFRMTALKWLQQHNISVTYADEQCSTELAFLKNDPQYAVLYQNTLFAIRTNLRVINSLMPSGSQSASHLSIDFATIGDFPKYSFKGFLNMLSATMPTSVLTTFIDWLISSLYLEFGIIAVFIINEDKLNLKNVKINDLAYFIADAAQDFGAISKELRPSNKQKAKTITNVSSKDFLLEQEFLAEQDLELLKNH